MESIFTAILISFTLALILSPLVINLVKKLKLKQNIYEYVDMHKSKQGTPTMGGIIFIVACVLGSICLFKENSKLAYISLTIMVLMGVLGFLDDFIKVFFKRNLGLKPYQKIIGQVAIGLILSVYAYSSNLVGSRIFVPFTTISFDLGIFYIPLMLFVFIAITNSVNLTDGLDGFAGGVSVAYLSSFIIVLMLLLRNQPSELMSLELVNENMNMIILNSAMIGGLLAYLMRNCFPASVFMGDTGSLALGGLIGATAISTGQVLLIPILGIMFVISCVSVVIQVIYYKLTKKRVFLMAPLHHHFEKKGMNENKIVVIYIVITIIIGALGILLTLLLN